MTHFDVLTQPWIPVERITGEMTEVGLRDALVHAHDYRQVILDSPLEEYAVQRLMIAFLMDALQLEGVSNRRALFNAGHFEADSIDQYVATCKPGCFDLFDKKNPFMQAAYVPALDDAKDNGENKVKGKSKDKPIATLVHELPSGGNHIHFDHRLEEEHALTPAQALRALLASYVFCVSGTAGPSSVNNTPCVYVLCGGKNLFETLVLSMVSKRECGNLPYGTIAWKDERTVLPKEAYASVSLLEAYTWRPRRVMLIADETQMVLRAYIQPGLDFRGNDLWKDPHIAFGFSEKGERYSLKPQPGRALWRDVGVLAFAREEARTNLSPLIVASRSKIIPADESLVALKTYALGTDQAQYTNWKRDELMLPSCLLEDALRGEVLRQDMNFCEQVANLLQKEVKKSSAQIADEAQMAFFEDVHLFVFGRYMEKLIQMDVEQDHAASVVSFDKRIEEILRDCLEKSLTRLGDDGKKLIRQVVIRNVIYGKYRKMRKERENGDE